MQQEVLIWVVFNVFILAMLALDLGVFHRKSHTVSIKEALVWSAVWVTLALLFNLGIYFWRGPEIALEFLSGYLIEKSLSVDNIFVFLLIFSYFHIQPQHQHKVLFWGILGALIMRAAFIAAGSVLITAFHWVIYIFGVFLVLTGIKMALHKDQELHPEKNPVIRLLQRFAPIANYQEDGKFFTRRAGILAATPLFVALLLIETADLVFALDSIPAVFAITLDPFIVYTSNVFAILGLRALYFALAESMRLLYYLHYGLSTILVFVGAKMLLSEFYEFPAGVALGVIVGILAITIIASILRLRRVGTAAVSADPSEN